ncbi:LapA family protein [Niveibacterium terrae]|uniref:LapA family protein n=1 Tax=Niveibacterium terrae TaxID=3373598 RepID=UPI003A9215B1
MRILIWLLRALVFFVLLGFALKNDALVSLRFFFETEWRVPLIVVVLAAFAAGVLLGVTAAVMTLLTQRREIARLRESVRVSSLPHEAPRPVDYPRTL